MAKAPANIRSAARAHMATAIKVLAEIMADPSAPHSVRVDAATQIINRGYGALGPDHVRFVPEQREFYVYSIHTDSGKLIYVGKGCGRRNLQSARRLGGRSRIRATFTEEKQALAFESRLIKRFSPPKNTIHAVPENRAITGNG